VIHDPDSVIDYRFDWRPWLHDGETIVSYTLDVTPAGDLTVSSDSEADGVVLVLIGGGVEGRTYYVTNHVVSSEGREDDLVLELEVSNALRDGALGACEWPVAYPDGPCGTLASLAPTGQQMYEDMATEYLWRWTGRQFGVCSATIRPCQVQTPGGWDGRWTPVLVGGSWFNLSCGQPGCATGCRCDDWGTALKFDTPVYSVSEVLLGGAVLHPSAYRQDLGRPLGEAGTWAVTVKVGSPVPGGGQVAAGVLACELAKAAAGDKNCALPRRWQTITRQGVTVAAAVDTFDDVKEGRTGIWLIDSWVASVTQPDIGFSIASPDLHSSRKQTSPRRGPGYYGGGY
jgi:hypothetical protein